MAAIRGGRGGVAEGAGAGVDDDYVGGCVSGDVGGHCGGEGRVAGVGAEHDRAGVQVGGSAGGSGWRHRCGCRSCGAARR